VSERKQSRERERTRRKKDEENRTATEATTHKHTPHTYLGTALQLILDLVHLLHEPTLHTDEFSFALLTVAVSMCEGGKVSECT
jgi:hypothetical protein